MKLKLFARHTLINLVEKLEDLVGRYKNVRDCIEAPSSSDLEMTPRIDDFNFSSK